MRLLMLLLTCFLLSAFACFAEIADTEQLARGLSLHKLATDVKELERCMGIISVENITAFEPIVQAYNRKADELARGIEDYVSRYSGKRGKQETIPGFKYRVWNVSLQAGAEKARPASALNRELCSALTLSRSTLDP